MISVGTDDREVHVVLLAILAWHCRRDGKEHGIATLYNGDQSNEIAVARVAFHPPHTARALVL